MSKFDIEPLADQDRTNFYSGVDALDTYFKRQVGRKHVIACFVAVERENKQIAGYYTLSAGAVLLADLPEAIAKKLPRYPQIPVAKLGRLAVAKTYQGMGLGAALLWDAYQRASRSEVMAFALVIDAIDETAQKFYAHHGFYPFGNDPLQLMLPLHT